MAANQPNLTAADMIHAPAPNRPPTFAFIRFIDEYLITLNATASYKVAHPNVAELTARTEGSRTLTNPNIAAEIARRQAEIAERNNVTDKLVRRLWSMATADVNELMSWRVGCCRYCHGIEHRHQCTDGEYAQAYVKLQEAGSMSRRKGEDAGDASGNTAELEANPTVSRGLTVGKPDGYETA